VSMVYSFNDAAAPSTHHTQYFELVGNRAIYDNGWVAATTPLRLPWITFGESPNPDDFPWELYHVSEDFSEANNLATQNPAKLKALQAIFDREAKKYQVYPLDTSFAERADPAIRPSLTRGRTEFIYYPGMIRIPEGTAPDIKNKSFSMTAHVDIPEDGANGVIATEGGRFGGWGLLMTEGKPEFVYAFSNQPQHKYRIASQEPLGPGNHIIQFDFKYDGGGIGRGGTGTLLVDGKQAAQGRIEKTIRARFSLDETFDVGQDTGTPVVEDYVDKMPFKFTGTLTKFVINLTPSALTQEQAKEVDKSQRAALAAAE